MSRAKAILVEKDGRIDRWPSVDATVRATGVPGSTLRKALIRGKGCWGNVKGYRVKAVDDAVDSFVQKVHDGGTSGTSVTMEEARRLMREHWQAERAMFSKMAEDIYFIRMALMKILHVKDRHESEVN